MRVRDKILVIDDERSIRNLITTLLNANGYYPLAAENGAEARSLLYSHCPDAVILDLGLPDMDGVEILKEIREWSTVPVIVVSARTMERDKVLAFDLGADDYLEKPFGVNELLARVRTALRHTRISKDNKDIARLGKAVIGGLTIDYDKHSVSVDGNEIHLTPHEFKVVALLAMHPGKVVPSESITKEVWGTTAKSNSTVLRVHMANIRRKIEKNPAEPEYIFTELGVGYRMREDDG